MRRFGTNKDQAADEGRVERILASARPDVAPLDDDAAERIFRMAMAEAFSPNTAGAPDPPRESRRQPRRAWAFAGAGALATLLLAVAGTLMMPHAPTKRSNALPAGPVSKPAAIASVPHPSTGQPFLAAQAEPRALPQGRTGKRASQPDRRNAPMLAKGGTRPDRPDGRTDRSAARRSPRAGERPAAATLHRGETGQTGPVQDTLARLLVMVDPGSDALNVSVENKDDSVPSYAHVAAYTPDEGDGSGGFVTEATLSNSGGTETALYSQGRFVIDGESGVLHIEVTRVAGDAPAPERPGLLPELVTLPAAADAEPAMEPRPVAPEGSADVSPDTGLGVDTGAPVEPDHEPNAQGDMKVVSDKGVEQ